MSQKFPISQKNLVVAAFCFFLLKGLFWLAAGASIALAAR